MVISYNSIQIFQLLEWKHRIFNSIITTFIYSDTHIHDMLSQKAILELVGWVSGYQGLEQYSRIKISCNLKNNIPNIEG